MLKVLGQLPWRILYSFIWIMRPTRKPADISNLLDYSQKNAWFVYPEVEEDLVDGDLPGRPNRQAQAAVFYIHPTSYFSRISWNKPVTIETQDGFLEGTILPNQATVFTENFKVYAPKYAQATFAVFDSPAEVAKQALDVATRELERAFDHFLSEIDGMPFVIAGHSQGSYHAIALLDRLIAGTNLEERLIAVYAPGYLFAEAVFDKIGVPLCRDQNSPGCVQTWNAVTESHWLPPFLYKLPQPVEPISEQRGTVHIACTNPLNPSKNNVPASENKGAYIGGYAAVDSPLVPELVGAACAEGKLVIDQPSDPRFRKAQMSAGWYHPYEYGLFFANIRADAERRLAEWQRLHH